MNKINQLTDSYLSVKVNVIEKQNDWNRRLRRVVFGDLFPESLHVVEEDSRAVDEWTYEAGKKGCDIWVMSGGIVRPLSRNHVCMCMLRVDEWIHQ